MPSTAKSNRVPPTAQPALRIAAASAGRPTPEAACTVADSVVRFTVASLTPATARRLRSTRAT